LYEKEH